MIKFFRKIRQKMLKENKLSQYLIYAIGEIILVVIGILIALQINNWNEGNKTKKEEVKILNEIKIALNNDLKFIDINLRGHDQTIRDLEIIKEQLLLEKPTNDSLNHLYGSLLFTNSVDITTGPFETLKSRGLGLISNDKLRNEILFYYEQPVKYAIDKEMFLPKNFTIEYCTKLFNTVAWMSVSGKNQIIPNDFESLKKDKVFLNLLNTKIAEIGFQNITLHSSREKVQELIKLIDGEIHQN
jgi:uncharacterized protein with PQ loop repeat